MLELKPDYAEVAWQPGQCAAGLRRFDVVLACYHLADPEPKCQFDVHNNLGIAWFRQGKHDEAVACFRRVLELDPAHLKANANLGAVLQQCGKLDEAIACCRRALQIDPRSAGPEASWKRLASPGEAGRGHRLCHRALELDPNHAGVRLNLGMSLHALGKLDEAIAQYRRGCDLDPDNASARKHLPAADIAARDNITIAARNNDNSSPEKGRRTSSRTPH